MVHGTVDLASSRSWWIEKWRQTIHLLNLYCQLFSLTDIYSPHSQHMYTVKCWHEWSHTYERGLLLSTPGILERIRQAYRPRYSLRKQKRKISMISSKCSPKRNISFPHIIRKQLLWNQNTGDFGMSIPMMLTV